MPDEDLHLKQRKHENGAGSSQNAVSFLDPAYHFKT